MSLFFQKDLSDLSSGVHLIFPHSGGPVRGDFIGMHGESPVVTQQKVRISRCATGEFAEAEGKAASEDESEAEGHSFAEDNEEPGFKRFR